MNTFCRKLLPPACFFSGAFPAVFVLCCFSFAGECTHFCELPLALAAAAGLIFACFGTFLSVKMPFFPGVIHTGTLVGFAVLSGFACANFSLFRVLLFPEFSWGGPLLLLLIASIGGFALGGIIVFALKADCGKEISFRRKAISLTAGSLSVFCLTSFVFRSSALFPALYLSGGILLLILTGLALSANGKGRIFSLITPCVYFLLSLSPLRDLPGSSEKSPLRIQQEKILSSVMILQRGEEPFSISLFPGRGMQITPELFHAGKNLTAIFIPPDGKQGNKIRFAESCNVFSSGLEKSDLFFAGLPETDTLAILHFVKTENLKRLKSHLKEGGVLILKTGLDQKIPSEKKDRFLERLFYGLSVIFGDTYRVPGKEIVFFASDFPLVKDAESLEKKVPECFYENTLPPGAMSLLFPMLEKHDIQKVPRQEDVLSLIVSFWKNHEFFTGKPGKILLKILLFFRKHALLIGMILLSAYLVLRYFLSAVMERKFFFLTAENTFCTFGLLLECAFLFQLSEGELFMKLPLFPLVFFTGCLAGLCAGKRTENFRQLSLVSGIVFPYLLLFLKEAFLCAGIMLCLFMCGMVFVLQQSRFGEQVSEKTKLFLPAFCGASLVFPVLFLFPSYILALAPALLILPRIGRFRR